MPARVQQRKGVLTPCMSLDVCREKSGQKSFPCLQRSGGMCTAGSCWPCSSQGWDWRITSNTTVPNWCPGKGGPVPWLCMKNTGICSTPFLTLILSSWINETQEKKVGFSTGIPPGIYLVFCVSSNFTVFKQLKTEDRVHLQLPSGFSISLFPFIQKPHIYIYKNQHQF